MRPARVSSIGLLLLLVWVVGLAAGCGGEADSNDDNGTIYFAPTERQSELVRDVPTPEPPSSVEDQPGYEQIVEGFRRNASTLFARPGIGERIGQIERVFMSTGRYLELVAIYQQVVDEQGPTSRAAPRLAWAYIRLDQREQALDVLETLEDTRSDDPVVPFLRGVFWFNQAQDSREAMARTALAWQRTLELDPDFEGFGGLDGDTIRQQIGRITSRLPQSPEAMLDESSEVSEATSGGNMTETSSDETSDTSEREGPVANRGGDSDPSDNTASSPSSDAEASDDETSSKESSSGTPPETEPSDEQAADTDGESDEARASEESETGSESDSDAPSESDGPDLSVQLTQADLALSQGNLDRAETLYRAVLEKAPDHPKAQFGRARIEHARRGASSELSETVSNLLEYDNLDARLAYDMGVFAESKLDDTELAEQCWSRVRTLDADFAERMDLGSSTD